MADDERWLYEGEEGGHTLCGGGKEMEPQARQQDEVVEEEYDVRGAIENTMRDGVGSAGEEEEEESEDSGDDEIVVTINQEKIYGDRSKTIQTVQIKQTSASLSHVSGQNERKGKFSVSDFDVLGTIHDVTAVEVDMEAMEEKPWRKPGADITDYFNYGLSEDTWTAYCDRHRRLRECGGGLTGNREVVASHNTGTGTGTIPILGGGGGVESRVTSPPPTQGKDLEPSGISVITHEKRIYPSKVVRWMDFSVPPPGFPPSLPPPPVTDLSGPPLTMGDFPVSDPFGEYCASDPYTGLYEHTAAAQWMEPYTLEYWAEGDRYHWRRDDREERYRDRERRTRRRSHSRDRDRDRDHERERDRRERERKIKKDKISRSRSRSHSRHKKSKKQKKSCNVERGEEGREDTNTNGDKGQCKENKDKSDSPVVMEGLRE